MHSSVGSVPSQQQSFRDKVASAQECPSSREASMASFADTGLTSRSRGAAMASVNGELDDRGLPQES